MEQVIKKLFETDDDIKNVISEIKVIENLPYYEKFNRNEDREIELHNLRLSLRDYNNAKFSLLESLELEIHKEKCRISEMTKGNSLKTSV